MPLRAIGTAPFLASTAALVGFVAFRYFDRFRGARAQKRKPPRAAPPPVPAEELAGARSEAEALSDTQWLLDEPQLDFDAAAELPLSVDLDAAGDELEPAAPEELGAQFLSRATETEADARALRREPLDQNVADEIVASSTAPSFEDFEARDELDASAPRRARDPEEELLDELPEE